MMNELKLIRISSLESWIITFLPLNVTKKFCKALVGALIRFQMTPNILEMKKKMGLK